MFVFVGGDKDFVHVRRGTAPVRQSCGFVLDVAGLEAVRTGTKVYPQCARGGVGGGFLVADDVAGIKALPHAADAVGVNGVVSGVAFVGFASAGGSVGRSARPIVGTVGVAPDACLVLPQHHAPPKPTVNGGLVEDNGVFDVVPAVAHDGD